MSVANTAPSRPRRVSGRTALECPGSQADAPQVSSYLLRKGMADRILAALLLAPGLPLLCLLMALVRLTSRGPAVFCQQRVGLGGQVFTMYKLRSMRQHAEVGIGPAWSSGADPRVTPLGRLLRKLHLDELPQLFNVLQGDMSLIGPRPERPEFVEVLAEQIPGYMDRLSVLPGVTGLAQINLPPDRVLDDVRRKLVLDLEYIQHATLWLDIQMLFCTLLRMFGVPGATAARIACVRRWVKLDDPLVVATADANSTPAPLTALQAGKASANGQHNGRAHAAERNKKAK